MALLMFKFSDGQRNLAIVLAETELHARELLKTAMARENANDAWLNSAQVSRLDWSRPAVLGLAMLW